MKKYFDHFELKVAKFLEKISYISLMLVGLAIAFFLFREVYYMFMLVFQTADTGRYYKILEGVLSFFILFEFLTLIVTSIRNKGHVSLIFLLSLGVTALIRVLLIYHDELFGVLAISGAILILIIGIIILKKFIFPNDTTEDHL
ncbi:phosphate-starvation-inducible protein PsiE [Lactococcus hircilactis]|uniref:Protein PsiE n=1 Tax=Lactococcus hircilactis TaxID=1494462 RepID=A0A7X2CZQ8_9LACT|nr:phosphate-starvation-inducible protein PsiE [Lactococcus hircilactis]MQW38406.1 phosphate-starvation-inducible protein PsiE [Lactococcus hircilactis]